MTNLQIGLEIALFSKLKCETKFHFKKFLPGYNNIRTYIYTWVKYICVQIICIR